jgi:hypothetical protein
MTETDPPHVVALRAARALALRAGLALDDGDAEVAREALDDLARLLDAALDAERGGCGA